MLEMAQQNTHVTVTPFWKGVIVGVGAIFLWYHRGVVAMILRKLMHPSQLLNGGFGQIIDIAKLGAATGIDMPSSDPAIAFRQMRRYAFAAAQDQSPIVGLTHASYSLIALDILEEAVGRDKLLALGCDPVLIRTSVTRLQDMHGKKLEACDPYLTAALAMEKSMQSGQVVPGLDGIEYIAPTGA